MPWFKEIWFVLFATIFLNLFFTGPTIAQYVCTDEFGRSYSGNTIREIQQVITANGADIEECEGSYEGETVNQLPETTEPGSTAPKADSGGTTLPQPKETPPAQPGAFSKAVFIDGYLIPPECLGNAYVSPKKTDKSPCDVNSVLIMAVNVSRLILAIVGSVALVMFIYGGVMFVTAAGNTSRIDQGKTILTNTVIGILIILFSWVGVSTLVAALTNTDLADPKIFEDQDPLSVPKK